ncbi:LRRC4C [Branchiostoma lanceolatum]|uniref:LRRC4C protein n=1 Tax=Branchiostoma lanceolatum TaxID=7740 RepID=A0A8K0ELX3_BRALA|nr:LRRC4C [Branchiostoma lanceolatum]
MLEIRKLSATDILTSSTETDKASPVFSGLENIRILQLTFSEIWVIRKPYFAGLSKLVHLWLNNNKLTTIEAGAFTGLGIRYLALEDNVFTMVRCGWFSGMQWLLDIDLSGNVISSIKPCAFHGAPKLRKIHLSRNRLSFVSSAWFEGLQQLRLVQLSHNSIVGLQDLNVLKVGLANNPLRCSCTTDWLRGMLGESRQIVDLNQLICDHPPGLRGVVVANVSDGQGTCPTPVVLLDPVYTNTEASAVTSSDNNTSKTSGTEVPVSLATNVTNDNRYNNHKVTEPTGIGSPVSVPATSNTYNVTKPGSMDTPATPSTIGDNNAIDPSQMDVSLTPSDVDDMSATESRKTGVLITLGDTTEDDDRRKTVDAPAPLGFEGEDLNITCIVYWEQYPKITWTLPNGARLASEESTKAYPDMADKIQMAVEHKINAEGWPCHERGRLNGDCVNFFGKSVVRLMIQGASLGLSGQQSCTAETGTGQGTASISVGITKVISTTRKEGKETQPFAAGTSSKPDLHTTESRAVATDDKLSTVPPSEGDYDPSGLVSPLVIVVPTSVCFGAALMVICSIIGSKLSARLRN